MVRFLHTGDWQLGMSRHYLGESAQAEFSRARLDSVGRLLDLARRERCAFVLVCGDVFETNQVDRRVIAQTLDLLRRSEMPVFLLPGNHDPLDAASVYRSAGFLRSRPPNVTVLDTAGPRVAAPGVEIVAAPWTSKRPLSDLVAAAVLGLAPAPGIVRIVAGHGALDTLNPNRDDPASISLSAAESALTSNVIQYVALGDRHSLTDAGTSGRVRYAGAPEATDYDETDPGRVLVVDCDAARCEAVPHKVGVWAFARIECALQGDDDLDILESRLRAFPQPQTTIVKLALRGSLTLRRKERLDGILETARDLFAAVEVWQRHSDLIVVPEPQDFDGAGLTGFAERAAARLREAAMTGPNPEGRRVAADALGLLLRLARSRS